MQDRNPSTFLQNWFSLASAFGSKLCVKTFKLELQRTRVTCEELLTPSIKLMAMPFELCKSKVSHGNEKYNCA